MKKNFFNYNPKLKKLASQLRNKSTPSEILLWKYLKGKQRLGYDFHRQKPIKNYIVDFFCPKLNLAIEIDGISHEYKFYKDKNRQIELEKNGIKFLRFQSKDVLTNIENVIYVIDKTIINILHTPKPPLKEGSFYK
ncbi:MAG: hypothetical protein KatS3mg092_0746 [Patescibacteria group bacterium]|nr:MAG: hypothetical protein KatS3mg092_0746 [Patescibacteria group bacterium]